MDEPSCPGCRALRKRLARQQTRHRGVRRDGLPGADRLGEGDLTLAELNVPGVLRRPEKRLRKSHSEPPVSLSAGPKGSPGPVRHARTAGLHFSETLPSTLP